MKSASPLELENLQGAIEVRLEETEKERVADVRKRFEEMCKEEGLAPSQVWFNGKGGGAKGRKLPVKYKDDKGNTWTGQGAKPKWMGDKDPGEFKIVAEAAE